MTATIRFSFIALLIILVASSGPAYCDGGIIVDDYRVTNDGTIVFSDDFNDGDISDWTQRSCATILRDNSVQPPSICLYLDKEDESVAAAFHKISLKNPGVVELSANIWMPPVADQYSWSHNGEGFTRLILYSASSSDNIGVGPQLEPKESGYRIKIHWNEDKAKGGSAVTKTCVLPVNRWALLLMRLDPKTKKATVLLDGKEVLSMDYKPEGFRSFNQASVWGWLGHGKWKLAK